jgi:rare lipoprotein A
MYPFLDLFPHLTDKDKENPKMWGKRAMKILLILILLVLAPSAIFANTGNIPMLFYGEASWYGEQFHGRQTASGEIYDMHMLSAAHKTLPFGTLLRVTNLENDKSVTVRINDRGPFVNDRVLDLSMAAASLLEFRDKGTAKVEARVVQLGDGRALGSATASGAGAAPQVMNNPVQASQEVASSTPSQPAQSETVVPSGQIYTESPENAARPTSTVLIIRPEDVRPSITDQPALTQQPERSTAVIGDPNGRFVIQAGAFLSLDNAENLLRRYQGMGLPVYLRQLPGEYLQRVWVGPFATRAEAEAHLDRVRALSERAFISNRH